MGFAADRDQMRHEALHQVRDAIRLDDRDEYSQWTYGNILAMLFGRYDEAVSAYREALEINPNFSLAYGSLGTALSLSGDADESIRNVEISIRLNPRDPSLFFRYSALAMAHFAKGDYLKAKEWALRTIARRSNWWLAHAVLVASLCHLGDNSSAQEALHELLAIQPDRSLSTLPLPPMHRDQLNRLRQGLLPAGMPA